MDMDAKLANDNLVAQLTSSDPVLQKEASDGVEEYLRLRAREDFMFRHILTPYTVTRDQLTKEVDTRAPAIVKDMEPNSPGAYSVAFGTLPSDSYMGAERYRVMFHRIMSHNFKGDIMDLVTYDIDLREMFNDLMLKDIGDEEDRSWINRVDEVCGTKDVASDERTALLGSRGYISVGAWNRASFALAKKGMPSTNRHLPLKKLLVNNLFVENFTAMDHDALGGSGAEEIFYKGFTSQEIGGKKLQVTIKTDLVGDDSMYMFSDEKTMGDFCILEDLTLWSENKAFRFEMFMYETIGGSLANPAAVCKAEFSGSAGTWRV